jgi:hypothetical protein
LGGVGWLLSVVLLVVLSLLWLVVVVLTYAFHVDGLAGAVFDMS